MSGTFQVGQVFSGGTLGLNTGQFAFAQTGSVDFDSSIPPAIADIVISQDEAGNAPNFEGVTLNAITITGVETDQVVTLTTNDLPAGTTLPPGFTLPENVTVTLLDVTATTSSPFVSVSGTLAVLGIDGTLDLVANVSLTADALGSMTPIPADDIAGLIFSFGSQDVGNVSQTFTPQFTVACFATGTRIATTRGDVAAENLRVDDIVFSHFGGTAPVTWIGHRRVDCRRHPRPQDVWPIRVQAGAFGPAQPARDLMLSPDHAVYQHGVLIPVRHLVNGASIAQIEMDDVTYWHVELPAHDVILAEGLTCESYLDTGNRAAFANGGVAIMAHPDFALATWEAEGCAPIAVDGPAVDAVRATMLARAIELGHWLTSDPDLHVVADGRRLELTQDGEFLICDIPDSITEIRLVSRSSTPSWTAAADDHRRLGVAITALSLNGQPIARTTGWHAAEAEWQWTDGNAGITAGSGRLALRMAVQATYWTDRAAAAKAA